MEAFFVWAGIALCLFSIWAIARHDWIRLTRPSRRVMARVSGHRSQASEGTRTFAAIYVFADETGTHEVVDSVYHSAPSLEAGVHLELVYPQGHPELARPSRPLMWVSVYVFLLALPGLLFSAWMDWLP